MGRRGTTQLVLLPLREAQRSRTCRLCRKALEDKRRTAWCGDECVTRWRLANGDGALLRRMVRERDGGRCASCGVDTLLVVRVLRRLVQLGQERHADGTRYGPVPPAASLEARAVLVLLGWSANRAATILPTYAFGGPHAELWEADHVRAVVLGGPHELENLRTLCNPCHDRATAQLAADRAAERRAARKALEAARCPPLPGLEA